MLDRWYRIALHARQSRRWPRAAAAAVAAGLALVAAAAPADGASLTAQRAQAAVVQRQVDRLDAKLATRTAALDAANARVAQLQRDISNGAALLAALQRSYDAERAALARMLVTSYKTGGMDSTAYVFGSHSLGDLIDRVDVISRISSGETGLIREIAIQRTRISAQENALRSQEAAARVAAAEARHAQSAVAQALAARQAVLARIDAGIRRLLAQEHHRRTTLSQTDGGTTPGGRVFYGESSWYGPGFAGQPTASGEPFDPNKLTCASPWLPFNTMLQVTSTVTGRSVVVRVNDRGPFGRGVLDLSARAASVIGLSGWQMVRIEILPAPHTPLTP